VYINSNNATLSIGSTTTVTDPVAVSACQNNDVVFSVTAGGSNLTYQWLQNGAPLSDNASTLGSTTSQLSLLAVQPADEALYSCEVTGTCNIANSLGASLTVEELPVITVQPSNLTICQGSNATFSVTATGENITYAWLKNGVAIPVKTNATITISGAVAADAGNYACVVSNACNSINSNTASLTINIPVAVTASPANITQCEGTLATFSVTATGSGLNYQWYNNLGL
jgi:hypothetical protein